MKALTYSIHGPCQTFKRATHGVCAVLASGTIGGDPRAVCVRISADVTEEGRSTLLGRFGRGSTAESGHHAGAELLVGGRRENGRGRPIGITCGASTSSSIRRGVLCHFNTGRGNLRKFLLKIVVISQSFDISIRFNLDETFEGVSMSKIVWHIAKEALPKSFVSSKYMYTIPPEKTELMFEPYRASTSVKIRGFTS